MRGNKMARGSCRYRRASALVKQERIIAHDEWEKGCEYAAYLIGFAFGAFIAYGIYMGWS